MSFISTTEIKDLEPLPGWKGKFLHSDNMSFMHYSVSEDAVAMKIMHLESYSCRSAWMGLILAIRTT